MRGKQTAVVAGEEVVTVRLPIAFRRRGARKAVIGPEGSPVFGPARSRHDDAVVNALARAHRWKKLLETANFSSLSELAESESTDKSYLAKVLRLTLLAPEIVAAILDGDVAPLRVESLLLPFPVEWAKQQSVFLNGPTGTKSQLSAMTQSRQD